MLCQAIPKFLIILLLTDAYSDINFEKVSMKVINEEPESNNTHNYNFYTNRKYNTLNIIVITFNIDPAYPTP